MDRRRFLALASAAVTAGCGEYDGPANIWPEPLVLDHFRGDPYVRDIRREPVSGGPDRFHTVVENTGHDAAVRVRLHWVTEGGYNPRNMTQQELRAAGYVVADERTVRIASDVRRTVRLTGEEPTESLGFFLKARNLTYGAEIGNAGGAGTVTATLVDTTDLGDTRELGRKTVTLPADGTVDVLFRASETFETFRVDVSTPIVQ